VPSKRVQFLGKPRDIVSPCVVEVVIQEHRWKQAKFERRARSEPFDDLPGRLIFFVRVGPGEVEVELIGVHFGQEIAAAGEGFQVEELVFFEAMDGFDVALVGVRGGRDAHVLTVAERGREAGPFSLRVVTADELAAVVGLPD